MRRRHEQELVSRAAERRSRPRSRRAVAALEAEHYLPLRPVRVWVAAPAEPAGEEWSAEALDRLRARLAVKQALCADLDGRLVCIAGARGMAGAAVMEALGALTAPRALVGQGEAVDDLREAGDVAPARARRAARRRARGVRHGELGGARRRARRHRAARLGARGPARGPAQAAGRRPVAGPHARGLPRPRGRREAHRRGAVPAPRRPLLPAAPDRGGGGREPARRRGPPAVPPRAQAGAAQARQQRGELQRDAAQRLGRDAISAGPPRSASSCTACATARVQLPCRRRRRRPRRARRRRRRSSSPTSQAISPVATPARRRGGTRGRRPRGLAAGVGTGRGHRASSTSCSSARRARRPTRRDDQGDWGSG